eukprot:XP_001706346.1 Hypothetical protein GL50803_37599 [Giardia lamblia ATCC 50803]
MLSKTETTPTESKRMGVIRPKSVTMGRSLRVLLSNKK